MRLHAAIAGGGVAGLAAAALLTRVGVRVTLFERATALSAAGAGLLLQPTGLAVLDAMKLGADLRARGQRIERLDCRTVSGRRILDLDYQRLGADFSGLGVHRGALFAALYGAVQEAGVEIRTGVEVLSADAESGQVTGVHGPLGTFDLIIVASGAHGVLRGALGAPVQDRIYPWGCLWTVVRLPEGFDRFALHQRVQAATHMLGVLPIGDVPGESGRNAALFWSLPNQDIEAWREAGRETWLAQVDAIWPEAARLLRMQGPDAAITHASYRDVCLHPAHRGRIIAIGDAAHATSPQLGQGANLALLDAAALAMALAGRTPHGLTEGFAAYRRMRRAHHTYYRQASRLLTPVFQSRSRMLATARDVFAPFGRLAPFDRLAVTTLAGLRQGWLRRFDLPAFAARLNATLN